MEVVLILMFVVAGVLVGGLMLAQSGEPPARGRPAPPFELAGIDGSTARLAGLQKRAVIVFHPQDDTPECVRFVEHLARRAPDIDASGAWLATVVVSDGPAARAYAERHGAGLRVLADPRGRVARAYGCLVNFLVLRFARKLIVLVDSAGRVERVWRDALGPAQIDELVEALGTPRTPSS